MQIYKRIADRWVVSFFHKLIFLDFRPRVHRVMYRQCVPLFEHTPACLKLIRFVPFIEADFKGIKTHSIQMDTFLKLLLLLGFGYLM